jgi:hypothetical protein
MDRGAAAKIGGMDRQTLRDWVHRFNASGLDGLFDNWTRGPNPLLLVPSMGCGDRRMLTPVTSGGRRPGAARL